MSRKMRGEAAAYSLMIKERYDIPAEVSLGAGNFSDIIAKYAPKPVEMGPNLGEKENSWLKNVANKENGEKLTLFGEGIKKGSSITGLISLGALIGGVALSFTGIGASVGVPLIAAGLTGLEASYGFYLAGFTASAYGHAITANNIENNSDLNQSQKNLKSDIVEGVINLATIGIGGTLTKTLAPRFITWAAGNTAGQNILRGVGVKNSVLDIAKLNNEAMLPRDQLSGSPAATGVSPNANRWTNSDGNLCADKIDLLIANDLTPDELKNFWIIRAHEQFGEIPIWKNLVKWPTKQQVKPYLNGLSYDAFKESLGADVVAARIIGKDAVVNGRIMLDPYGRNWWLTDPILVRLVEEGTMSWYGVPFNPQTVIGGTETVISITDLTGNRP